MTKCTELTDLQCNYNQLAKLNLSNCAKLDTLWCGNNQLTKLDVTKNTKLKFLSCQSTGIKKLDLSKNADLAECRCPSNRLTELTFCNTGAISAIYATYNLLAGEQMDKLIASLPEKTKAFITVYVADNPDQEQNVCTKEQVAAANAKGWTVYQWLNEAWTEYEGSDPTAIDNVPAGSDIQDASAPAYNLSGQRVNGSQKGIIIRNGRKYLVK